MFTLVSNVDTLTVERNVFTDKEDNGDLDRGRLGNRASKIVGLSGSVRLAALREYLGGGAPAKSFFPLESLDPTKSHSTIGKRGRTISITCG